MDLRKYQMSNHNVTRQLLTEIDRDPAISQKRLAEEIGISVGMINWHVKRCVGKGLIKLQQAPVRRYLYYLTPDGFTEKATLTANYLRASFDIFQKSREQYDALFSLCQANGWNNIFLIGDSELTELALLVQPQFPDLNILGIIDEASTRDTCGTTTIFSSTKEACNSINGRKLNAAIACHYLITTDQVFDTEEFIQETGLDRSKLLIPGFLQ